MTKINTDTSVDVELLVGDMPVLGCECDNHEESPFHADGDEQYVRLNKPCGHDNGISVWCMRSIRTIFTFITVHCSLDGCDWSAPPGDVVTVLGPANP